MKTGINEVKLATCPTKPQETPAHSQLTTSNNPLTGVFDIKPAPANPETTTTPIVGPLAKQYTLLSLKLIAL